MMSKLALFLPILLLVSCASPEARVRTALIDAGLSPRVSSCMAERMVDRLSIAQLRKLGSLRGAGRPRGIDGFLHSIRVLDDPEVISVTTRAALRCAIRA